MAGNYADYPDNQKEMMLGKMVKETTRNRLTRQRDGMLKRIDEMNRVITLLDQNPNIEELLDLLSGLGREY